MLMTPFLVWHRNTEKMMLQRTHVLRSYLRAAGAPQPNNTQEGWRHGPLTLAVVLQAAEGPSDEN